jgi:hypothetical protein
MSQTSVAVLPIPIALPTSSTTGPVRTRESATSASRMTMIRVTSSCSGRSFRNGRPSGVSQITLAARMKAPM